MLKRLKNWWNDLVGKMYIFNKSDLEDSDRRDLHRGIIYKTDSYKFGGHFNMLVPGTTHVSSYMESRVGAQYDFTKFFGLQAILKKYFAGPVVTEEEIQEAVEFAEYHLGNENYFNADGFRKMLKKHKGCLPLSIQAVSEGMRVPTGNVLMQVVNTDPEFPWLTNYVETLLTHVWYPSTVCTKSAFTKDIIAKALLESSDIPLGVQRDDILPIMCHDFGYRGVSSQESAEMGGAAHLINFRGTDTLAGIQCLVDYYGAETPFEDVGTSVIATEHSIQTSRFCEINPDVADAEYLDHMLDLYPEGVISLVGDGNSIVKFLKMICDRKDRIIERGAQENGMLNRVVVRPDSPRFGGDTPEDQVEWIMDTLYETFGGEMNSKGRRVLHSSVGCIYGDGLSTDDILHIYTRLATRYDVSSVGVGQGGGLLQKLNRDTNRFAFKCSAQMRDGKWIDVWKQPLDATKASKKGRLALVYNEQDELETIREDELNGRENQLREVFRDGKLLVEYDLDDLREDW